MRGQIVEQIKIIHFRGGEVKWGMGINPGYDELLYTCSDLVSTMLHYADQLRNP